MIFFCHLYFNNFLSCVDILSILKHIDQNLSTCYEALLQEMTKKRAKCPRLYLLNDEDLLEILCSNGNLEHFSCIITKVFNGIDSLRIDTSTSNEKKIVGCYGKNMEYFCLKTVRIKVFRES